MKKEKLTMILTIKDKDYELHFGLKFIRELDKKYEVQQSGIVFGAGLDTVLPALLSYNIATLSEILYFATITSKPRPSIIDIDNFVESHENVEELLSEVIEALQSANGTKLKTKMYVKDMGFQIK